jgi:AmiR/NasT family two-component response regulator
VTRTVGRRPIGAGEIVDRLLREVAALRTENDQLRAALESRIAIEQAKGVLAERFATVPEVAFEALRRAARSHGRRLRDLASEVVTSPRTPAIVLRELHSYAKLDGRP